MKSSKISEKSTKKSDVRMGQRFRDFRKSKNWTQKEIANKLAGCWTGKISELENAKAHFTVNIMRQLIKLGMDITWLLTGKPREEATPPDYTEVPDVEKLLAAAEEAAQYGEMSDRNRIINRLKQAIADLEQSWPEGDGEQ